jgi:hypothetical protein
VTPFEQPLYDGVETEVTARKVKGLHAIFACLPFSVSPSIRSGRVFVSSLSLGFRQCYEGCFGRARLVEDSKAVETRLL